MKTGTELITEERQRQIEAEGRKPEDDLRHSLGQMAGAAACYSLHACGFENAHLLEAYRPPVTHKVRIWPWAEHYYKPTDDPIRALAKAGALIAAEIDRLNRLSAGSEDSDVDALLKRAACPNRGKRLTP